MPVNITEEFNRYLAEQNPSLSDQAAELTLTAKERNQTIRELKEQLNNNSKNSSKPHSLDRLKKPMVKKGRRPHESSEKKEKCRKNMAVFTFPSLTILITQKIICISTVAVALIAPTALIKHV